MKSFHQLQIKSDQSVEDYLIELKRLASLLANAKPEKQPVTPMRLRRQYLDGLQHSPRFKKAFEKYDDSDDDLATIHRAMVKAEGRVAKKIAEQFGTSKPGTANQFNLTAKHEECRFYIKNGWCGRGHRCKRRHPPGKGIDYSKPENKKLTSRKKALPFLQASGFLQQPRGQQPRGEAQQTPRGQPQNQQVAGQYYGQTYRRVPNRICTFVMRGQV